MRILYIDVDALRPDHLGCYGYPRSTSPTIDRIAEEGVRFDNCYISDAPCLPSRTAMTQGRFGIHSGVVNHGGAAADLRTLGPERGFNARPGFETWFQCLQEAGFHTASISPFPQRHGGWWFLAGLNEWHNPGGNGKEDAHEINDLARPWLEAHAEEDQWFLHVNYWDPHTPYSTPDAYGNPFEDQPPADWYGEEIRQEHWEDYGTFSAQDPMGHWFPSDVGLQREGVPTAFESVGDWKAWVNGYDVGIRYMDDHIQGLLDVLAEKGVLDETLIIVTGDHGENQGELNIYGDHQTADEATCRVPLIMRPPNASGGQEVSSFHYQFDAAATVLDMVGAQVPEGWDAESFSPLLRGEREEGRDHLVLSQMAWSCQRSVRFDQWLFIRTYHPGLKNLPKRMLFDVEEDPHQVENRAAARPHVVDRGQALLEEWHSTMMRTSATPDRSDPLQTVLDEGGPFHPRGRLQEYVERLRETGRADCASLLLDREGHLHPAE
jgi:arylsulfatase A-like enzyme